MRRCLFVLLAIVFSSACTPNPTIESRKKGGANSKESVTQTTTAGDDSRNEGNPNQETSGSPSSSSKGGTGAASEGDRHFRLRGPTPHGQYDYQDVWDSGETKNGYMFVDEPDSKSKRQLHSRHYGSMEFSDGQTLIWSDDATYVATAYGPGPLACSFKSRSLLFVPGSVEIGEKWELSDTCESNQGSMSWTFAFERFDAIEVEGASIPAAVIHANSRHSEGTEIERTLWLDTGGKGLLILKSHVTFRDGKGSSSTVDSLLLSTTPKPIEE